jgi:hypothetical protein
VNRDGVPALQPLTPAVVAPFVDQNGREG